jgi:Reverse transcriptase (RNA-dependent DNA polymerase)
MEASGANTAPGPDGIGNRCIKKIWKFIRLPLLNYANHCLGTGNLTNSFKTASIKLIPKKGDPEKIKNWRPISLLNCTYKILSKAINERLKKVSNRVLSRGQKGFTSGRFIQECIINITETIEKCGNTGTKAFVLALDQAKAFDSIRHDFMRQVFKFFGFPELFIDMIMNFTTNRTAAVILNNGKLSQEFPLGIGSTQGNGPSPLQFNFCEQIFIFKIELDPTFGSVYLEAIGRFHPTFRKQPVLEFNPESRNVMQYESHRETDNVECFADDATLLGEASPEGIRCVKNALDDFAVISGLRCNIEKSVIMPIGYGNTPVPDFIVESGFAVVTSIKILGVVITPEFRDLKQNFDKTITNLTRIANHWSRFNLSLPGRIAVFNTFMLSQVGYLGCILSPAPEQIVQMESIVTGFVKG